MGNIVGFTVGADDFNSCKFNMLVNSTLSKYNTTQKEITINGTIYTENEVKLIYDGIANILPSVTENYDD